MKTLDSQDSTMSGRLETLFRERGIAASARIRPVPPTTGDLSATHDLDVTVDGARASLRLVVRTRWSRELDTLTDAIGEQEVGALWMIVLPHIDRSRRDWLRDRNINYADMRGTMHVRLPGIRIDVEGDASRMLTPPAGAKRHVNPFSKKASLILRTLFASPHAACSVSELARTTGVAVGWAWDVSAELCARGYATETADGIRLTDAASVLIDWAGAYSWRKCPRRNFVVPFTQHELEQRLCTVWANAPIRWALTLLSGAQHRAEHVRHANTTYVYVVPQTVNDLNTALADVFAREIATTAPDAHTLCVLTPYYGTAALFGSQGSAELPIVSDLQLFLDLAHFPLRGIEVAQHLLRTRLGPHLSLSAADVARVERRLT